MERAAKFESSLKAKLEGMGARDRKSFLTTLLAQWEEMYLAFQGRAAKNLPVGDVTAHDYVLTMAAIARALAGGPLSATPKALLGIARWNGGKVCDYVINSDGTKSPALFATWGEAHAAAEHINRDARALGREGFYSPVAAELLQNIQAGDTGWVQP